jgi:hypothetical protein
MEMTVILTVVVMMMMMVVMMVMVMAIVERKLGDSHPRYTTKLRPRDGVRRRDQTDCAKRGWRDWSYCTCDVRVSREDEQQ